MKVPRAAMKSNQSVVIWDFFKAGTNGDKDVWNFGFEVKYHGLNVSDETAIVPANQDFHCWFQQGSCTVRLKGSKCFTHIHISQPNAPLVRRKVKFQTHSFLTVLVPVNLSASIFSLQYQYKISCFDVRIKELINSQTASYSISKKISQV